jgi:hypothetical protein
MINRERSETQLRSKFYNSYLLPHWQKLSHPKIDLLFQEAIVQYGIV